MFGSIWKMPGLPETVTELVLGAIYAIFGLALLSMCLNLVQEDLTNKFTWIGHKIGLHQTSKSNRSETKGQGSPTGDMALPGDASGVGDQAVVPLPVVETQPGLFGAEAVKKTTSRDTPEDVDSRATSRSSLSDLKECHVDVGEFNDEEVDEESEEETETTFGLADWRKEEDSEGDRMTPYSRDIDTPPACVYLEDEETKTSRRKSEKMV
ncbi:unnamed protein product [Protopolystoma xenopodis]|uniref:Potassium channel domain-containing protein n=1 Tax=Protopolystoma xenopodis TaxID=117903 RepID=A0A3S4ZME7_9PLAT|nr:unnamed protein product [Protopolystoma xenopodis]